MRAGLVIYGSPDTLSGGYLYDRKLVERLRRGGDSVEIISLPWRNYPLHLKDNFSDSLLRRLAGLRVDVLLQDELNHPSLFLLNRRLKGRAGYPIVSIVHHLRSCEDRPGWQNVLYRHIESRYLSSVDGFIFNSRTTRSVVERMLAKARATMPPGIVAYPGGDRLDPAIDDRDIVQRVRDDTLRLLFIGNLIPRKGLHVLLKALEALRNERWALTIVGSPHADPAYARYMYRQVLRSNMEKKVVFTGILGDGALADRMRASHLLVVPSSYEGYGIAYIEGMGFGLPSIGTTGGAAREIVTDGRDGFLVSPGDAGALADRISAVLADRRHLLEMSLAARERYRSHPPWDVSMGRARDFLIKWGDSGPGDPR